MSIHVTPVTFCSAPAAVKQACTLNCELAVPYRRQVRSFKHVPLPSLNAKLSERKLH
jgi:hypothetical protein